MSRASPQIGPGLLLLTIGKASRVVATFWSFQLLASTDAGSSLPIPAFLLFALAGSSSVLLLVQQPWKGKRIGGKRLRRIFLSGCIFAVTQYLWLAGLRASGPLRTLLLDGAELPLLYIFSSVSFAERSERARNRGVLFMLLAYVLLFVDASGRAPSHVPALEQLESSALGHDAGQAIERLRTEAIGKVKDLIAAAPHPAAEPAAEPAAAPAAAEPAVGADPQAPPAGGEGRYRPVGVRSEVGVVLILLASGITQLCRGFTRRLAAELGGAKRYFSLCVTAAALCIAPVAALSLLRDPGSTPTVQSGRTAAITGFLWLVLPYYTRAMMSPELNSRLLLQVNLMLPFVLAAASEYVLGAAEGMHGFSVLLLVVFALDTVGVATTIRKSEIRAQPTELPYRDWRRT